MTAENYRRSNWVVFWVYMVMYVYQFVTLGMAVVFTQAGFEVILQFAAAVVAMVLALIGYSKFRKSLKCGVLLSIGAVFMYFVIMAVGKTPTNFVFALPMMAVLFLYQDIKLMTRVSAGMGISFAIQFLPLLAALIWRLNNLF